MARVATFPAAHGGDDAEALPVSLAVPGVAPSQFSAEVTAPAANAVIVDSGNIAAGVYLVEISLGYSGVLAAGKHIVAQHRNVADSANVALLGLCPAGGSESLVYQRVVIVQDESIRVVAGAVAGAAAEVAQAVIRLYKLAS